MSPREFQVNWDDVAKSEVIPEGRYAARIDKVEQKESANKNSYLLVTFTIMDEPATGRKVWGNFMLSPTSLWKLRDLMKAIGLPTAGVSDINLDELINAEVGIVITNEMFEDAPRSRVQKFYSLSK
jgi:hypothetical protein